MIAIMDFVWNTLHSFIYESVSRVSSIHPSNLIAVNDARQQRSDATAAAAAAAGGTPTSTEPASFIPGTRTRFGTMDSNCPVCLNQLHLPIETNCGHLFCGRCIIVYWHHAQWRGGAIRCPVCRQQVSILLPCFATNITSQSAGSSLSLTATLSALTADLFAYLLSFIYTSTPSTRVAPSAVTAAANGANSANASQSPFHSQGPPDDLLNNGNTARNGASSHVPTNGEVTLPLAPPDPNQERTNVIREINSYNRRFSGEPRPWSDYLYDLPTLLRHLTNDFFTFNGLMYMFRLRIVLCVVAAIMYLISPLDMIPEAVFGIFGLFDDIVVLLLLTIYVTIIYRRFLSSRWELD